MALLTSGLFHLFLPPHTARAACFVFSARLFLVHCAPELTHHVRNLVVHLTLYPFLAVHSTRLTAAKHDANSVQPVSPGRSRCQQSAQQHHFDFGRASGCGVCCIFGICVWGQEGYIDQWAQKNEEDGAMCTRVAIVEPRYSFVLLPHPILPWSQDLLFSGAHGIADGGYFRILSTWLGGVFTLMALCMICIVGVLLTLQNTMVPPQTYVFC